MLALQFVRSIPNYLIVRAAGGRASVATGELSMLHLGDVAEPQLPAGSWHRVRPSISGICGSDIAAITGHASFYLDNLTSYPFIPGHELSGRLEDGTRVVVQPVLGCAVRGVEPLCRMCAQGRIGICENVTEGNIHTGLQTGYCCDTGGGWGETLVAHESQLYEIPDGISDEVAMLTEPMSCSIHAAFRGGATKDDTVLVAGAGALGLLTVAAVRHFTPPKRLICIAKYPFQAEQARRLGADQVISPSEAFQRVRFATGARRIDSARDVPNGRPVLLGGADVTFECAGNASSLNDAVRLTRGGGKVILVGMPGEEKIDWAPIWQRELLVTGAYAYGVEPTGKRTFEMALEAMPELKLDSLAGPLFALDDYREAIPYAMASGRMNAVRVAFDLRDGF